ncbi:PadR family transcriptional regulator [Caldalkalibacillus mannanilyticus]|uniref:PadR family transcriptional regulator n=1 Tax=Caldalkalibacillus mannanilyticus TaxID=1418 RepID=UPI000469C7E6|nr:PadR family transcriptional regulator [Caldalkalibacillus mannanilyticus]
MNTQFKKGVLELCVLSILREQDHYGYNLVKEISSKFPVTEGTIYPLLRRLTAEEYVTTYLVESEQGPARKYYTLTEKGSIYRDELALEWKQLVDIIRYFNVD